MCSVEGHGGCNRLTKEHSHATFLQTPSVGQQAVVILDGEAAVEISGTPIATLGAGKVVGEMALVDHSRRSETVTAITQPTPTEPAPDHGRLRRRAIVGSLSALELVLSWWLVPVLGCIFTILAVLVVYGIVAPEPIDTYLDGHFDRHRHARW
jgi:hypothetical protein